jgi:hypothetical protein
MVKPRLGITYPGFYFLLEKMIPCCKKLRCAIPDLKLLPLFRVRNWCHIERIRNVFIINHVLPVPKFHRDEIRKLWHSALPDLKSE